MPAAISAKPKIRTGPIRSPSTIQLSSAAQRGWAPGAKIPLSEAGAMVKPKGIRNMKLTPAPITITQKRQNSIWRG